MKRVRGWESTEEEELQRLQGQEERESRKGWGERERERKGDRHTHREQDTGTTPPLFTAQSVHRS